jgi:hypothetical protein
VASAPDPFDSIVGWTVVVVCLAVTVGPIIWGHIRRSDVLANGVAATARIVDIQDTSRRHNTNPVVRVMLVVTDDKGHDFKAEVTMPVSPVRLAKLQPGAVVKVKYDPKKPANVAIEPEDTGNKP